MSKSEHITRFIQMWLLHALSRTCLYRDVLIQNEQQQIWYHIHATDVVGRLSTKLNYSILIIWQICLPCQIRCIS